MVMDKESPCTPSAAAALGCMGAGWLRSQFLIMDSPMLPPPLALAAPAPPLAVAVLSMAAPSWTPAEEATMTESAKWSAELVGWWYSW
jgi:hypothetical protein